MKNEFPDRLLNHKWSVYIGAMLNGLSRLYMFVKGVFVSNNNTYRRSHEFERERHRRTWWEEEVDIM